MGDDVRFEAYRYFDAPAAIGTLLMAAVALAIGAYTWFQQGFAVAFIALALGGLLAIGFGLGVARRRSPICYVRITDNELEWMQGGKRRVFDWSRIAEINYSDTEPPAFIFGVVGGERVTCLSDFTPQQERDLYAFFVANFRGQLMHKGVEWRGPL